MKDNDEKLISSDVFNYTVSITELSQGKISSIIRRASKSGQAFFVLKNNKPVAVLMSFERYEKIEKNEKDT